MFLRALAFWTSGQERAVQPDIPSGTALIVTDGQECGRLAFDEAGSATMPSCDHRVRRTTAAVDTYRRVGRPMLFAQEEHQPNLLDLGRELDGAKGVHCVEGAPGIELVGQLTPAPGEHLIREWRSFWPRRHRSRADPSRHGGRDPGAGRDAHRGRRAHREGRGPASPRSGHDPQICSALAGELA